MIRIAADIISGCLYRGFINLANNNLSFPDETMAVPYTVHVFLPVFSGAQNPENISASDILLRMKKLKVLGAVFM